MLGVGLALGASVLWGFVDFLGGLTTRRAPLALVASGSQAIGLVGLAVALLVFVPPAPETRDVLLAGVAGLLVALSVCVFYSALAIGMMSSIAPIPSIGVAIPVIVGLLSGDDPRLLQLAGIGFAILGVYLVSRGDPGQASRPDRNSLVLALIAALCFGAFLITMDAIGDANLVWVLFVTRAAATGALVGFALCTKPQLADARGAFGAIAVIAAADLAGNALFFLATRHGLLSLVALLSSLYSVVTILFASVLLGERLDRTRRAGVVCTLCGVALVASGA